MVKVAIKLLSLCVLCMKQSEEVGSLYSGLQGSENTLLCGLDELR